ncbi:hypothetical protein CB1_000273015 [Camelus ferus]|nr:hypothetical protein CB1_000273015 [Camelus ferus]
MQYEGSEEKDEARGWPIKTLLVTIPANGQAEWLSQMCSHFLRQCTDCLPALRLGSWVFSFAGLILLIPARCGWRADEPSARKALSKNNGFRSPPGAAEDTLPDSGLASRFGVRLTPPLLRLHYQSVQSGLAGHGPDSIPGASGTELCSPAVCGPCFPDLFLLPFKCETECGFGFGEDARCASCRPLRFKEDWGFQQCKPCLDCALLSRLQKANCSATADAVCGDCLPGFYRKTMLVGFQDVECVPCGDPPPPYEPHYERTSAHVQAGGKERAEGLTVSHERTEGRQARLGPHGCWRASLQRGRGPLEKSGPRGPTGLWLQGGLTRFSPGTVGASAAGAAQAASEAAPRHTVVKVFSGPRGGTVGTDDLRFTSLPRQPLCCDSGLLCPLCVLFRTEMGMIVFDLHRHGSSKVNLVRIPSTASSPRDTALAAVICSALATVLLALLTLCVIYCKRQFMEKKPSWSLRTQDPRYQGSELSCFDRPRLSTSAPRVCCQCHRDSPATCGPVHLTASGCCDGVCIVGRETPGCRVHSKAAHQERSVCGEFSDAWPLMQNPSCGDDISSCDSYAGLTGEDVPSLSLEDGSPSSLDPSGRRGLVGEAAPIPAHLEDLTETTDLPRHSNSLPEPVLTQDVLSARSQRGNRCAQAGLHRPLGLVCSLRASVCA